MSPRSDSISRSEGEALAFRLLSLNWCFIEHWWMKTKYQKENWNENIFTCNWCLPRLVFFSFRCLFNENFNRFIWSFTNSQEDICCIDRSHSRRTESLNIELSIRKSKVFFALMKHKNNRRDKWKFQRVYLF